jgi:hypothetical protein
MGVLCMVNCILYHVNDTNHALLSIPIFLRFAHIRLP